MTDAYAVSMAMCQGHAQRLRWAMDRLHPRFPLSDATLEELSNAELAVLDQFSLRFSKL